MAKAKTFVPDDCMPKCGNCAFFAMDQTEDVGECHRNPPVVIVDSEGAGYSFPCVPPSEWCGLFQRRLSA